GSRGPEAVAVDGPRDQFLTDARFTHYQDGGARGSHERNFLVHLNHLRAMADQPGSLAVLFDDAKRRPLGSAVCKSAPGGGHDPGDIKGLANVIEGALANSFHSRFQGAKAADQYYLGTGGPLLELLQ